MSTFVDNFGARFVVLHIVGIPMVVVMARMLWCVQKLVAMAAVVT